MNSTSINHDLPPLETVVQNLLDKHTEIKPIIKGRCKTNLLISISPTLNPN